MLFAKTILAFSGLAAIAQAGSTYSCQSCHPGTSSDCVAAFNLIPTTGTLSSSKDQQWTSGDCTIEWITNGVSVEAADFHGEAQALVNKCCEGSSSTCSGVAYNTGSTNNLEGGCVCMHSSSTSPCICEGTPSLDCI
ncbi:hypothetical protein UA08_04376 [Talaromyces atroroseus]|uniref:Cyanovirin-N domain-containing protein n=1 Tax=Talaromyces atroroseus TaxID=1441469 RepID=A0A1Q5Q9I5_TALAT|nr:hypothetical protein UA08_04376 [Talaromyces atroroseus]OKL60732.1 hypothetical protein UA08_04376 [Talaromyces atroroseus]